MHSYMDNKKLIAVIFILSLGCASAESSGPENFSSESKVIGTVPFVKQKYRFCGPAALASVMMYYGKDIDQDEIAENVYTPELKGSLISDMKAFRPVPKTALSKRSLAI